MLKATKAVLTLAGIKLPPQDTPVGNPKCQDWDGQGGAVIGVDFPQEAQAELFFKFSTSMLSYYIAQVSNRVWTTSESGRSEGPPEGLWMVGIEIWICRS